MATTISFRQCYRRSWKVNFPHKIRSYSREKLAPQRVKELQEMTDRELVTQILRHQKPLWWVGGIIVGGVTLVAFGPELKLGVSKHTAEVATKSLQDEALVHHTRELASEIVQTVLNDPKVLDQASQFIQRLLNTSVTQEAVRKLVIQVLNDPTTFDQIAKVSSMTVKNLLENPQTKAQLVNLLQSVVLDSASKESLLKLIEELLKHDETRKQVAALISWTLIQENVKQSVANTLSDSVHDVLSQQDIQAHTKEFVGSVVQDQTVQAQSGEAIWSTIVYAMTPEWLSWLWGRKTAEVQIVAEAYEDKDKSKIAPMQEGNFISSMEQKVYPTKKFVKEGKKESNDQISTPHHSANIDNIEENKGDLKRNSSLSSSEDALNNAKFVEDLEARTWNGTGSGFL